MIRVRDDGIGIAAEHLPRLFEMFAQVDTSLERSRDGLGIGLTLVKTLVEMHGGTVEVHSEGLGRGSEFEVRLPALAETPRPPASPAATGQPARGASRRILIVDDNEDGAESLAMLLQLDGHETYKAHDGVEAIDAARAAPARCRAARHRPAEAERLRGVPPHPAGAVGQGPACSSR